VLCLYTDGLVERRDRFLDDGIARLCSATAATEPEAACASVMTTMADGAPPGDDVALLILRRRPGTPGGRGPARQAAAPAPS
jgi:hypothetical protein